MKNQIKNLYSYLLKENFIDEAFKILKLSQMLSQEEEEELSWEELEKSKRERQKEMEREKLWLLEAPTPAKLPEEIDFDDTEHSQKFKWLLHPEANTSRMFRLGPEKLKVFIDKNRNFFSRLFSVHGNAEPKYLGSGAFGSAWLLEDGNVLKIMDSHFLNSYKKSFDALFSGYKYGIEEAMIHDIGAFDSSNNLGWAILEGFLNRKMFFKEQVDGFLALSKLLDMVEYIVRTETNNYLDNMPHEKRTSIMKHIDSPLFEEALDKILKTIIYKLNDNFQLKHRLYQLAHAVKESLFEDIILGNDWITALIRQVLTKRLSGRYDLHSGNLGIRMIDSPHPNQKASGYFIFYDW